MYFTNQTSVTQVVTVSNIQHRKQIDWNTMKESFRNIIKQPLKDSIYLVTQKT